jgi:uncharacterized protein HemX
VRSSHDIVNWKLLQANYLVELAFQNLWSNQDLDEVVRLLSAANNHLLGIGDSEIIRLKEVLEYDINYLKSVLSVSSGKATLWIE